MRSIGFVLGLTLAHATAAHGQQSCTAPNLRALVPPADVPTSEPLTNPQLHGVLGSRGMEGVPLGVGHLRPSAEADFTSDWHDRIVLPIFGIPALPDDDPGGWMMYGRLIREGNQPAALYSMIRMVATDDSRTLSYLVDERRADGWLGIRVSSNEEGVWWTHECLLDLGEAPLTFVPWESVLSTDLYFVDTTEHTLRAAPSDDAEVLLSFRGGLGSHLMTVREMRGDWMRVALEIHGYRCAGNEPWVGVETSEGWVLWREPEGKSRVYHIHGICR